MTTQTDRPHGFTRRPEPRSLGSALRGQAITEDGLSLTGGNLGADPFASDAQDGASDDLLAELHGFGWLDDLAAAGHVRARDCAQQWVLSWIAAHPLPVTAAAEDAAASPAGDSATGPLPPASGVEAGQQVTAAVPIPGGDGPVWAADIAGRRLVRWIFHAGMILPGLDRAAAQPVFDAMHAHLGWLARADAAPGQPRIEAQAGRAIAAMVLRGAAGHVAPALAALAGSAGDDLDCAVLRGRCPEAALNCLSMLGWVKAVAADSGHDLPAPVTQAIERIAPVLRALRHADGGLPRFHGGGRGAPGRLDHSLRAADGPAVTAPGHPMGFARLARARATVILDAAPPAAGPAASHAHASTLGLEFTAARHPVVVNCGSGRLFGPAWARASRATACHSTLCLSGLSSAKLLPPDARGQERLTLLPQRVWAGECDAEGNLLPPDAPPAPLRQPATILAGHDGWDGTHGLTHLRELYLSADGDELRGEDTLAALDIAAQGRLEQVLANAPDGIGFDIRFHLHPEVEPVPEGDLVRLILPGGEEWVFSHDLVAALRIEPSAWLETGLAAPQPTTQIVLAHRLDAQAVQIGWTFMRADAS
ncbi:MAG: heparinase II/III family protein [Paracoccus sp. (in: a-proteobacteria)]|nr:heparinase II/III family protein [Paracoccus sp. (in: a-proteobacteria)]